MLEVLVRLDSSTAKMPTRGSKEAAGIDMYADLGIGEAVTIFPGNRSLISLGVSMAVPEGWYLQLKPRSGLAFKNGIMVMGGVIDSDYRDTIYALLYNSGSEKFTINHLDRVLQGVFLPVPQVELTRVGRLPDTERGTGGFGSTGK